ncbi:MAG: hypothetical protein ACI3WT_04425 [Phascolarctobacterium sp.]
MRNPVQVQSPVQNRRIEQNSVRVGDIVSHSSFGTGNVVSFGDGVISVAFRTGIKKFQYPESLQIGHLQVVSGAAVAGNLSDGCRRIAE